MSQTRTPEDIARTEVRQLWEVTIRQFSPLGRVSDVTWHVVTKNYTAISQVLPLVRQRYPAIWWEDRSVSNIKAIGTVEILDGVSLYQLSD